MNASDPPPDPAEQVAAPTERWQYLARIRVDYLRGIDREVPEVPRPCPFLTWLHVYLLEQFQQVIDILLLSLFALTVDIELHSPCIAMICGAIAKKGSWNNVVPGNLLPAAGLVSRRQVFST